MDTFKSVMNWRVGQQGTERKKKKKLFQRK